MTALLLLAAPNLPAQSPAFYHLSTAEGLSDNFVNTVCRDRNGILWIGTSEGLNSFDGNAITTFYKDQHPLLPDNNILQLVCDDQNILWLRTASNRVIMLDANRRFHSFTIGDSSDKSPAGTLINTRSRGLLVVKGSRHFTLKDPVQKKFERLNWSGDSVLPRTIRFTERFSEDKIIFCGNDRLVIVDYATLKVIVNMPFPEIDGAARINDKELLVYTAVSNIFYRVDIAAAKIVRDYKGLVDQNGDPLSRDLRTICRLDADRFALTSRFSGIYLVDIKKETVQRWNHDPVDQRSIGGDNTLGIHYDTSGYIFVTTLTSGLHYFNSRQPLANYRSYFKGKNGTLFDGYIQAIASRDSIVWLGTQDRLIRWNRVNNQTEFVNCYTSTGKNLHGEETIRALWMDQQENLWTGTSRYGILVINKKQQTIAHLFTGSKHKQTTLPSNWINGFCQDAKGFLWVATARGLATVDPVSYAVQDLSGHPVISALSRLPCNTVWFDKKGRLWAGTNNGAWCYWPEKTSLREYNTGNGLSHNRVLAFNEDDDGNIYAGTAAGLNIIGENGGIRIYNRSNGLRNDKCEGILKDEQGYLWIGNLNCILRFDPATNNYAVFEEGFGFSHAGFRMRSCFKSKSGELFWGSDKGLTWFYPGQMNTISTNLRPSVNALQTNDSVFRFTGDASLRLPYHTNSFNFYFSSGELYGSRRIQFLYTLKGYDPGWKKPTITGQAGYSKLPPGSYRFQLRASRDGINWFDANKEITLTITKPWWQQNWFRVLYVAAFIGLIGLFYNYRQRRKKAAEIQQTIDYFAQSGYEHSTVDEILWDICRNCISGLGFEDCVIYLLDEERQVLVQKAAFGPKNLRANEIANPIEIPIGRGIVGHVAHTGKSSLVPDTTKDPRYIIDDEKRNSEVAVPLVHDGKVIGVIDSENKQKNFFTGRHLKALQTIATLCSAKISRAIALDAMKKSRLELMELNMKMAESRFLNLRLQMNPHFLFNSLSSIQHLIVSQQTAKAYKYLTVFSNFLRSLLKYADKNFIPLDDELKIVSMYVELESLRFDQSFRHTLHADESLANDEVLVPSLIVQPFVENAIWHGLLHREGEKLLSIQFNNNSEEYLTCIIQDNGIGREKAAGIKKNNINSMVHESRGIAIIRERLELLQQKTGKPASVEIEDLKDSQGLAAGTRVVITIPYYNPDEI